MESNQDNDYIARQLQSIEVIKLNNDKDDNAVNISRSAKELGHAPSPSSSLCCIRIIRTGRTSTTRSDYGFLDFFRGFTRLLFVGWLDRSKHHWNTS